ncbi:hypothetical protein V499_01057 [Pseudogymnoascus sp. VKM F-103]|nr:hypothetical protein V499_01057 [Pseudogymnoascus sp. VKM F-103]
MPECTSRDWTEQPSMTTRQLQKLVDTLELKIRLLEGEIKAARQEVNDLITSISNLVPEFAAQVSKRERNNNFVENKFEEAGEMWMKAREEVDDVLVP